MCPASVGSDSSVGSLPFVRKVEYVQRVTGCGSRSLGKPLNRSRQPGVSFSKQTEVDGIGCSGERQWEYARQSKNHKVMDIKLR